MPAISLKNRFIFIHIPKTAGTSLALLWKQKGYIAAQEWKNWYLKNDHISAARLKSRIDDEDVLSGYRWQDFYKFSIVRNPFDLLISYWQYKRRSPSQIHHSESMAMDFNDFVFYLLENCDDPTANPIRNGQFSWLEDLNQNLLVDKVIRLDDLTHDYKNICKKIGIEFQLPAVLNATAGPFYNHHEYYNSESRVLVERIFETDLNKYEFEFRRQDLVSFVD